MKPIYQMLAAVAYKADYITRGELNKKVIISERDYVSVLCSRIRDSWAALGFPSLAHAQTLEGSQERIFGCDAFIAIKFNDFVKIGLFEAKWPRLSQPAYPWDYVVNSPPESHFSSQLDRQNIWVGDVYIWEQLIHEDDYCKQSPLFDEFASSCIPHNSAYLYNKNVRSAGVLWDSKELLQLRSYLKVQGGQYYSSNRNIYKIICSFCNCTAGRRLKSVGGFVTVSSNNKEKHSVNIPVDAKYVNVEQMSEFMLKAGINNMLLINI